MGLASLTIALCFAEVGSRFEGTGGPYLYTRAAFGRFAGVRSRLDAVVHARVEPGEHHGRHRGRARLLLAGDDGRLAACGAAHRA